MPANAYRTPTPGPLGPRNLGADYNAGVTTSPLILTTEDGSAFYTLFIGTGGKLYVKAGTPSSATDGTVVGTQT
jgi:hypothetical protein